MGARHSRSDQDTHRNPSCFLCVVRRRAGEQISEVLPLTYPGIGECSPHAESFVHKRTCFTMELLLFLVFSHLAERRAVVRGELLAAVAQFDLSWDRRELSARGELRTHLAARPMGVVRWRAGE